MYHGYRVAYAALPLFALLIAGCDVLAGRRSNAEGVSGRLTEVAVSMGSEAAGKDAFQMTMSGSGTFNDNGTGTLTLSVPTLADERESMDPSATMAGAPGLSDVTVTSSAVSFHVGANAYSAPLTPGVRQLMVGHAARMVDVRERPQVAKNYAEMTEAEFVQEFEGQGFSVTPLEPGTYRLSRETTQPGGVVVTTNVVIEKQSARVLSSEIYRGGHLVASQTHEFVNGQHRVQVTGYGRPDDTEAEVSYTRTLPN